MRKILIVFFLLLAIGTLNAQYTWVAKNIFPDSGYAAGGCFVIDGKGYIVAGFLSYSPPTFSAHTWEYDPVYDSWTRKADAPNATGNTMGFAINGKGYIVGGAAVPFLDEDYSSNVYEYDPAADKWTQKSNFPENGVAGTQVLVVDSLAYLVSGIRNSNVHGVSSAYSYNPNSDTWAPIASYPGPPSIGISGFVLDNLLYVGTGSTGGGPTYNGLYCYNPKTNSWLQKADFPGKGRNLDGGHFVFNGLGYFVGGGTILNASTSNFYDLSDCYGYNPASNTWQAAPSLPDIPRDQPAIFSFPNSVIVVGGYGHDVNLFSRGVWEFTSCPRDTVTIYRTVNDTMHITVRDTVHSSLIDTNYTGTSTTGTMYINVQTPSGENTLQVFADSTGSYLYINNGVYADMTGYAIKISNAQSVDVFVSQINQQQFYIDLNTWTGPGTYVLYVINPQLQVVATRIILVE